MKMERLITAIALLPLLFTAPDLAQAYDNDDEPTYRVENGTVESAHEYDRLMDEGIAARQRFDFDSAIVNFQLAQEAAGKLGDEYNDRACAEGAAFAHFYAATAAKGVSKDPANQLGTLPPKDSFINNIYVFTLRGALDQTLEDLNCL